MRRARKQLFGVRLFQAADSASPIKSGTAFCTRFTVQAPPSIPNSSLRALDASKLLHTAEALKARVHSRFPSSGLSRVSTEVAQIVGEAKDRSRWLAKPIRWMRGGTIILGTILGALPIVSVVVGFRNFREVASSLSDFTQGIDAIVNEALLLSAAIYFLVTIERRVKRSRALKAIHELRSLAHIIDMHQLIKDPEILLGDWLPDAASPQRPALTPFQLERYLDYCSELLAVLSKVAALFVQHFEDEVVLRAVDEVENLASGLSNKIWQKITILDRLRESHGARGGQ